MCLSYLTCISLERYWYHIHCRGIITGMIVRTSVVTAILQHYILKLQLDSFYQMWFIFFQVFSKCIWKFTFKCNTVISQSFKLWCSLFKLCIELTKIISIYPVSSEFSLHDNKMFLKSHGYKKYWMFVILFYTILFIYFWTKQ